MKQKLFSKFIVSLMAVCFCVPVCVQAQKKIPESIAIKQLKEKLQTGNETAISEFWESVEKNGTPIIEPLSDMPLYSLVTFLWKGNGTEKEVAIIGGPNVEWTPYGRTAEQHTMQKLANTNLWYKTYLVKNDARLIYLLSPNEPELAPDNLKEEWTKNVARQTDPFNPKKFYYSKDPEGPNLNTSVVSLVELPNAPPQPYIVSKPEVNKGKIDSLRFKSKILNKEYRTWIYTPAGYTAKKKYNALLLFDGWEYLNWIPTPTILDNLIHENKIPPTIAIFVIPQDRGKELTCSKEFASFIIDELFPFLETKYSISNKPQKTVVGGASLGGLFAVYLGIAHPERFGNVISQSGSFWWSPGRNPEEYWSTQEWLSEQIANQPQKKVRFFLEVGTLETVPTSDEGGPSMLVSNRHIRNVLIARGYNFHYNEFNGRHDYANWQGSLADGLILLLNK